MSLSAKEEKELFAKLDEMFQSALEHPAWREWRGTIAPKCFRYREGDQWTAAERAVLKKRHQPETVNNQVSVTINRLVGQFVKQKYRIRYAGRNPEKDQAGADALSDIMLFIRQVNGLEFEERDQVDEGFTAGFGVLECNITWDDTFQPEVKITNEDPFDIFPDPWSRRYDWNDDATFICRVKFPHVDEAIALYPKRKKELLALVNDSQEVATQGETAEADELRLRNYVDYKQKRVLLVEIEWKTFEKQNILLLANGQTLDADELSKADFKKLDGQGIDYRIIDRVKETLHSAVFSKGMIFETKELKRKRFKWVPFFMYRKKNGSPYSLIWLGLPMQDAINKRESKAIHLLNSRQVLTEKNNVEDRVQFQEELAKPDGFLEVRNLEKVKIQEHTDVGQIHYNLHTGGMRDFRNIVGVNPDALGEPSEVRSGVGIQRKVAMTDLIIAPIFDNTKRSRVAFSKTVLELVKLYYTPGKVMAITDDLNKTRSVVLSQDQIASIKQGIYDVVFEDAPDITTVQQEQFALLLQYLPQILQFGPKWTERLIQMSDIRAKDDILKDLRDDKPPPDLPKISVTAQLDQLTAPERGALWLMMGRPDIAQGIEQSGIPPTEMVKIQADQAKERGKAQADQAKAQGAIAKTRLEIEKSRVETAGKKQLMALDIQKKRIEVAKAAIDAKAKKEKSVSGQEGTQDPV